MKNPWVELIQNKSYVLESDRAAIEGHNKRRRAEQIITETLPEPFIGNVEAPIYILSLNPGYSTQERSFFSNNIRIIRNNLCHYNKKNHFYYLDNTLSCSPGYCWWTRTLRHLIEEFDIKFISENIFCVEYFPYKSMRFSNNFPALESQNYNFHLVQEAIKNNKLIVILRSNKRWFNSVGDLNNNTTPILLNSRNPIISSGNIQGQRMGEILKVLKHAKTAG